jgi:hypothetical protein
MKVSEALKGFYEDRKEIKSEAESLQQLAYKIACQLAKFWGIPEHTPVQAFTPRVIILENEGYRDYVLKHFNRKDADIDREIPKTAYVKGQGVSDIIVNAHWLSAEFEGGFYNIKSAIAEEVGHFIQLSMDLTSNRDVSEFFAMISRIYISEQMGSSLFRKGYDKLLNDMLISNKLDQKSSNFLKIIEAGKRLLVGKSSPQDMQNMEKLEKAERTLVDMIEHSPNDAAIAYYPVIREMKPEERYKLLMMNPVEFKRLFIDGKSSEMIKKLREEKEHQKEDGEIQRKIMEDDERTVQEMVKENQKIQSQDEKQVEEIVDIENQDENEIEGIEEIEEGDEEEIENESNEENAP